MNINDMNKSYDFDSVRKILESRFNWAGKWDSMTESDVRDLGSKATAKLEEAGDIRSPSYNLYLFIREAARLKLAQMTLNEGVGSEMVDQAEVVLAAQELGDKLQGMAEDIAQMQVQDMMPLVQAMKEQMGMDQAQAFESSATAALQGLLDTMKSTKESYDNAVLVLQGEAPSNDMMPAGDDAEGFGDMEPAIDTDGDGEMEPAGDEFGGADAEAGDDAPEGRDMKESVNDQLMAALKAVQENSEDGKISKAQLEAIKQQVGERKLSKDQADAVAGRGAYGAKYDPAYDDKYSYDYYDDGGDDNDTGMIDYNRTRRKGVGHPSAKAPRARSHPSAGNKQKSKRPTNRFAPPPSATGSGAR